MKNRLIFKIPPSGLKNMLKRNVEVRDAITLAFGIDGHALFVESQIFTCTPNQYVKFLLEMVPSYKNDNERIPTWMHNVQKYSDEDDSVHNVFPEYASNYPPRQDETLISITIPYDMLDNDDLYDRLSILTGCTPRDGADLTIVCTHYQRKEIENCMSQSAYGKLKQKSFLASDYIKSISYTSQVNGRQHYVVDNDR